MPVRAEESINESIDNFTGKTETNTIDIGKPVEDYISEGEQATDGEMDQLSQSVNNNDR
jgi:hypothetical protein